MGLPSFLQRACPQVVLPSESGSHVGAISGPRWLHFGTISEAVWPQFGDFGGSGGLVTLLGSSWFPFGSHFVTQARILAAFWLCFGPIGPLSAPFRFGAHYAAMAPILAPMLAPWLPF